MKVKVEWCEKKKKIILDRDDHISIYAVLSAKVAGYIHNIAFCLGSGKISVYSISSYNKLFRNGRKKVD